MPDVRCASAVSVRVTCEQVIGDVCGEIPREALLIGRGGGGDAEVDCGEVTGVIAVARGDNKRSDITFAKSHRFEGAEGGVIGTIGGPRSQRSPGVALTQFEHPVNAIPTGHVGSLNAALKHVRTVCRRLPADDHAAVGGWMHSDTVRGHIAGDANQRVGRVGKNAEGISGDPAFHELVVLQFLLLLLHVAVNRDRTASDAEVAEPGVEQRCGHIVGSGDGEDVGSCFCVWRGRGDGVGSSETGRGGLSDLLSVLFEVPGRRLHVPQWQVGATGGCESRVLPKCEIAGIAITGICSRQIKGDHSLIVGSGNFEFQ